MQRSAPLLRFAAEAPALISCFPLVKALAFASDLICSAPQLLNWWTIYVEISKMGAAPIFRLGQRMAS
jgi:hypothetical protein